VFVLSNRWPVGYTLRACFYAGDDALRVRIIQAAQPWFKVGNVKLDAGTSIPRTCREHDTSEIRISFDEPGDWSYIGSQYYQQLVDRNLSTLNLEGFDTAPSAEPRFSGTVLHEFGHALGFHHEHQSPANGCADTIDWNLLLAFYKDNYGWDEQKTRTNVEPLLADRSAYDWSTFDPNSIMIYATDARFLRPGSPPSCIFHDNDVLSEQDIRGMQKAYPPATDPALENAARAAAVDAVIKHHASKADAPTLKALSAQRAILEKAVKQLDAQQ
jgi:hypothetical protein